MLDELVQRVVSVLEHIDFNYELIFVNDNSTDRSLEIIRTHIAINKRIKVISMSRRFGVSPCLMAGLRFSKGDVVIYMDADLQDPPELIPEMITLYQTGADVVHSVRTERKGESHVKMWITKMAYRVINRMSDIALLENAGDFKLLSRRVVDEIIKLNEYQPYTRGLVPWVGFRQEAITYERDARFSGDSKNSVWRSPRPFNEFIKGITAFSEIPLYLSLMLGLCIALGAFIYLIFIIVYKFQGHSLPGWAAIMATMLLLGGIMLTTNGVIGIYIGRIFNNVKRRPAYIIESMIGFDSKDESNGSNSSEPI